jgi:hypothetical protein
LGCWHPHHLQLLMLDLGAMQWGWWRLHLLPHQLQLLYL